MHPGHTLARYRCATQPACKSLRSSQVSTSLWDSQLYGLLLMLGYLGFDGFTSTFQDKLFKGFQMTTYNQILYTTLWSSLLSCFGAHRDTCYFLLGNACCPRRRAYLTAAHWKAALVSHVLQNKAGLKAIRGYLAHATVLHVSQHVEMHACYPLILQGLSPLAKCHWPCNLFSSTLRPWLKSSCFLRQQVQVCRKLAKISFAPMSQVRHECSS